MDDLTISKGWFQDKDDEPTAIKKTFLRAQSKNGYY